MCVHGPWAVVGAEGEVADIFVYDDNCVLRPPILSS